jgi:hypothetical protein
LHDSTSCASVHYSISQKDKIENQKRKNFEKIKDSRNQNCFKIVCQIEIADEKIWWLNLEE